MKKVLITGINGQDGSYLAELLLKKGNEVHGTIRPRSEGHEYVPPDTRVSIIEADIRDAARLSDIVGSIRPDEIYNLAAQSHVGRSFAEPALTAEVTGIGAINVFEAVRLHTPNARIYQASSSEMFGSSIDEDGFQRETTRMEPASPYACAKVFAYMMARNYRNAYGMFISSGILFNHESPRRPPEFVTSKICREAVRIKLGLTDTMNIGNLDAMRDWGHSRDFVRAMWMMMQLDEPGEFVCATGVPHSVRELVQYAFSRLGLDWQQYVKVDPSLQRREELKVFKGDSSKLRNAVGWAPEYTFESMLDEIIDHWQAMLGASDAAVVQR